MRKLGSILCFVGACSTVDPAPPGIAIFGPPLDESGDPLGPLEDREQQGTTILGGFDTFGPDIDTPYYFLRRAKTQAGVEVDLIIEDGEITYAGMLSSETVQGMTLTGYDSQMFTIDRVEDPTADNPRRYYILDQNNNDPCNGTGAVAQAGRYSVDARLVGGNGSFSLACEAGEVYKCNRWGYGRSDKASTLQLQYHQACVNMAGARYCNDRRSFTREKTEITIFDADGIRANFAPELSPPQSWWPWTLTTWPAPNEEFYIESAFLPDGRPKCLRRARWASLPPDPCDPVIQDPRVTPGAKYCEDLVSEGTLTDGVLLVVASRVGDARFDVWRAPNGDLLGTARGFREQRPGAPPRVVQPYNGFTFVSNSGVLLRVKTEDMIERGVQTVFVRQYCEPMTNNCVVSTSAPPGYSSDRGVEGQLFVDEQPDTVMLKLWRLGNDYVSATVKPGPLWSHEGDLGWIYENPE